MVQGLGSLGFRVIFVCFGGVLPFPPREDSKSPEAEGQWTRRQRRPGRHDGIWGFGVGV